MELNCYNFTQALEIFHRTKERMHTSPLFDICTSGAESLRIEFDRQCSTERRHDPLTIMDGTGRIGKLNL